MQKDRFWNKGEFLHRPLRREFGNVMQYFTKMTQKAGAALMILCIVAGSAPFTGITVQASEAETALSQDNETEESSFDLAISDLYRDSGELTDSEILDASKKITSDAGVLLSSVDEKESRQVVKALDTFEESKAEYMTARINHTDTAETAVPDTAGAADDRQMVAEWNRQCEYAQMMIADSSVIKEMVPRYQIKSCKEDKDTLELGIQEWMTQAYGTEEVNDAFSTSAYSYTYSLKLHRGEDGTWAPSGISGTDANYTWLGEGEDPVQTTQASPLTMYEVKSDLGTATKAYAQISGQDQDQADAQTSAAAPLAFEINSQAIVTDAPLTYTQEMQELSSGAWNMYGAQLYETAAGAYTYSPAKAVAYADKYWSNYNRSYKEYRGVDCANFVSQCLFAGGMPTTDDWYPQSVNWINVMGHIRHFKEYGSFMTAANTNVRVGNPVYYDWNGNGVYDHVGLCVGTNASGMPVVDAHTSNVYHVPWSMGSRGKRATIVLRAGSGSSQAAAPDIPRNTWQTVGGKVYYLGADGKRVKNSWKLINGLWYYFKADGTRKTGFFKIRSKWYYASVKTGALLKGWQKIGKKWYFFSTADYSRVQGGRYKLGKYHYYFNSKGAMQTGFIKSGKKTYYADKKTGRLAAGWKKISGKWYYFNKSTNARVTGWKKINGKKYYFNSKGVLKKEKH